MARRSTAALQLVGEAPRSSTSRTGQQPVSTLVRERLLAGEELTNRGVQAEYGISNDHTVSDAATRLRNEGYIVIKDKRVEKGPTGRPLVQTFWRVETKTKRRGGPSKRSSQNASASISARLRQRMMEGEALTSRKVSEEYGVSRSLLGVVLAQMRLDGISIDMKRIKGGQAEFRLAKGSGAAPSATRSSSPREKSPSPSAKSSNPRAKLKSRRAIYADLALRFENGERIHAHTVMNDYGVTSIKFLAGFLAAQRKKGWTFTRVSRQTEDGWRTVYRLKGVDPKGKPAWAEEPPTDESEQVVDVTDYQRADDDFQGSPASGSPPDLPPLATQVSVVLHLWDPETGTWTLGLRNGQKSWLIPVADGS